MFCHLRSWAQFQQGTDEGILPLPGLLKLFSGRLFRRRLDPDYFSRMREYGMEWMTMLQDIGKTGPFWSLKNRSLQPLFSSGRPRGDGDCST